MNPILRSWKLVNATWTCTWYAMLLAAGTATATSYTNVAASGAWNANATWTPNTSYPQLAGDTATINSNTVTSGSFVIPTIQLIDVTAAGNKTGTLDMAASLWQTAPLQLNSGILKLENSTLASNALTVKADSQIYVVGVGNGGASQYSDLYGSIQNWVLGAVTNTGKIWVKGDANQGSIHVRGNGTNFSGGWDIVAGSGYPGGIVGGDGSRIAGGLAVYSDGGLGTGTATVHTTLRVWSTQTATAAAPTPAKIVVQPSYDMAGVWLGVETFSPTYISVTNWNMDFYGGALVFSDRESVFSGGVLNVYSNMTFSGKRDGRWTATGRYGGEIRGPGRITINPYWYNNGYGAASAAFYLSGNNTNFTGGVTLLGNNLYLQHTNALGSTGDCWFAAGDAGTVYLQNAAGAANWTLGNNLGGINTLQVENGTAYSLTLAGSTLQPGTNVNAVGKLTIAGNLLFSTNAAGGYAKLIVDVTGAGGVAGTDFDQLVVNRAGVAATIGNCDLVINLGPTVEQLSGQTLTIVTNANDNFTGQSFHSVTWQNVKGVVLTTNVVYRNGAIQLQVGAADPVISNQGGATGMTSNSATLNGYLSVTGNAPTEVYVFWGPQDQGKTRTGWGGSQYLGTNAVGSVMWTATGLTPDTINYYRYYATNAFGECWVDPATSFVTMPNYSQYGYRTKIQFQGYNRSEVLTNFPALVNFNTTTPGFLYSQLASTNGNDLRFSNSNATKNLNFEIENWSTNGTSAVWVQVDLLASSNDFIWAYYGNSAATASPAVYSTNGAAWSSPYRGVWHLGQPNAVDSTTNGNKGTASGNTNATAIVANGQGFAGGQSINCGNAASVNVSGDMTCSAWVKRNATGEMGILGKWGNSYIWDTYGDKNSIYFNGWVSGTNTIPVGQWVYLSFSFANATKGLTFYYNGQPEGSSTYSQIQGASGPSLYIGYRGDGSYMNGLIDEARLEATPRSSNWIWACYMNMASNSAFNSSQSQLATPVISNQGGVSNKTAFSADLNGYLSWTGSAPTEVYVFYGKQDQYPNRTGWDGFAYLGTQTVGSVLAHASGLTPNTNYLYRCYATNSFGENWASPATAFTTPSDSVAVDNDGGASGVTAFQATLNGDLVSTGGAPTAVWVFFGDATHSGGTGNTNKSQWQTSFFFGNNVLQGAFLSTNVTVLVQNTAYYYNFYASNVLGAVWGVATNFTTLPSVDYTDKAAGNWNSTATWTPSTGYPSNTYDSATIASNTVQLPAGYVMPSVRLINLTTNSNGSGTGTLYFAENVSQTAPIQLNGGALKLNFNYPNACLVSDALTVKADSQINQVGLSANGGVTTLSDIYGAIQDSVQGGVTNTGRIWLKGDTYGGINVHGTGTGFSGGWDITGGANYPGAPNGSSANQRNAGGLVVYSDGGLGSGTDTVHTTLRLMSNQSGTPAVPPPARIVVQPSYDMAGVWLGEDNYHGVFSVTNWNMDFYGGALVFSDDASSFSGGILTAYSNMTFAAKRDGRWTATSLYGGEIRGPGRVTINPYWLNSSYGAATASFQLSGNNTNFSGGLTLSGNNLYLQHTNSLGTGNCWFDAADGGTVYLSVVPAVNWTLPNNIGGINTIQVQDGSGAYTLTTPGTTIQPGTNVNASGQLTVAGSLAFGTDTVGGTSKLIVDVTGTGGVAGTDFDCLIVTHALSNLNNATLVVNVATNLAKNALDGQQLIVATNVVSLASTFSSVTFNGAWHGKVVYNQPAGTVKLYQVSAAPQQGTALLVR
jgi:hypothetical protein